MFIQLKNDENIKIMIYLIVFNINQSLYLISSLSFSSLCRIYLVISLSIAILTSLDCGTNNFIILHVYSIIDLKSRTFLAFISLQILASKTTSLSFVKSLF
jgi:hypothetical protein